jgi:PAS domain-containing protein
MNEFLSADFLKFFVPLVGAVIAWVLNERRRRTWEEYLRKEERYRELLRTLTGFYDHAADSDVRCQFLEEYKRCWLYCSDDVIRAANSAMEVMVEGTTVPMGERRERIGEFVLAIRRDLLRRALTRKTALVAADYVHVSPGK